MPFRKETEDRTYTDFSNVEKMRSFLTAEELPEGAYGSPIGKDTPVENKSTPWKPGQQYYSNFTYENRNLHENLPRQMEGAHPTHDDPNTSHQQPYNNG